MNHNDRIELVREIANKIVDRYGKDIIGIALYGSVAKNEDAEYSDLEFWIATTNKIPSRDVLCIYKGQSIELFYGPADNFISDTKTVTPFWPLKADMRRSFIILHEQEKYFDRIHQAANDIDEQAYNDAIRERMLHTFELIGKLKNAREINDKYGILALARDITFSFALLIGLVNRSFYKSQRGMYNKSKEMPLKPNNYSELLDIAGGFESTDTEKVYKATIGLWEQTRRFINDQGIIWDRDELIL
jgi:kanamycin nucleotidyltransferase